MGVLTIIDGATTTVSYRMHCDALLREFLEHALSYVAPSLLACISPLLCRFGRYFLFLAFVHFLVFTPACRFSMLSGAPLLLIGSG